jgi:hypothetical protein
MRSRNLIGSEAPLLTDDVLTDYKTVIQNIINNSNEGETIKIGYQRSEIIPISQPVYLISNRNYIIDGTLRIRDGAVVDLAENIAIGDHTMEVVDGSLFSVGDCVSATDDAIRVYRESSVAWSGYITEIDGNILTIEGTSNEPVLVANNGRVSHSQGCIVIQDQSNIVVTGVGLLDGNRYNQAQVIPSTGLDLHNFWEHNRCGVSLAIWHCENITWAVDCKDGLIHTAAICSPNLVPAVPTRNKNITIRDCTFSNGHDKNILVRFTEDSLFENVTCEGFYTSVGNTGTWEDGLIFYSDGYNITVRNFTAKTCGRNGFSWNSENGSGLIADGITTIKCGTRNGTGIDVNCSDAVLSNLRIGDSIRIGGVYTTENIVVNNAEIICDSNLVYLPYDGMVIVHTPNVVFNNLTIRNSRSRFEKPAIRITQSGAVFNGGGIYNHTGYHILQSGYDRATWNNFENLVITAD